MRCIIQTFGQDGFINIEANAVEEDDDFFKFYLIEETGLIPVKSMIKAIVNKTELKSFYFSEKRM